MKLSPQYFMKIALSLAEKGRYTCTPNPMVGCVIVKNQKIIGTGYHNKYREPHAEAEALENCIIDPEGAEVYLNLEPCVLQAKTNFTGTTSCADLLIKAKVKKVFIAMLDSNPLVNGSGVKRLQAAGIEVKIGLMADQAKEQNEIFLHYIQYKKPFVIAKWALSINGYTTVPKNSSQIKYSPVISNNKSLEHVHLTRSRVGAILVGSKTIIRDNPLLNTRYSNIKPLNPPLRIVLTRNRELDLTLNLFNVEQSPTLVVTTKEASQNFLDKLRNKGVEVLIVEQDNGEHIILEELLIYLGAKQIDSLLVEGGMYTHEKFFKAQLVNKVECYLAPYFFHNSGEKTVLQWQSLDTFANNHYFSAKPSY